MKPTDMLRAEHRQIERMLDILETSTSLASKGASIEARIFEDEVRFLKIFADQCHHNKEEKLLFPAMELSGIPREGGPIAVMLSEHEEGRALVRLLEEAIERYSKNNLSAIIQIDKHARAFIELLRGHIYKEDNMLFVMADEHLSLQDQERLTAQFESLETSGDACGQKQTLLSMLDRMGTDLNQYVS